MCGLRRVDDALEFLRPFGPREGGARLVVLVEVLEEKGPKRGLRAVDAVREPLLAEDAEKTSMRLTQDACVGV